MCSRVTCPSCKKPTFAGCGRHVEAVLGDVPPAQRCRCREADQAQSQSATESRGGVMDWLLGGRSR